MDQQVVEGGLQGGAREGAAVMTADPGQLSLRRGGGLLYLAAICYSEDTSTWLLL